MINSKDLLAKLLASENIDVIRCKTKTASFDVEKRVLRLPQYTNISEDVEDMLIGHEVGHALYTDDAFANLKPLKKKIHNIVEDNRIERLIKNRYVGLRPIFSRAYSELFKRGFMGDGSSYNFLDKINVHGKVGLEAEITFDNDYERELMDKVNEVTTNEQVYKLVDIIYDYVVQQKADNHNKPKDEDQPTEKEEGKGSGDKKPSNEPPSPHEADDNLEEIEQEILDETDSYDILESQLAKYVDLNTEIRRISFDNYHLNFGGNDKYGIYDHKRLIHYMRKEFNDSRVDSDTFSEKFEDFYKDVNNVVSSMVKEFNLHKSADEYKRTATHKTGELNLNKLYAYRITDNIFKSISVVKSGKNHGLIALIDMSSSMNGVIQDVFIQVIHLALFCKRIGIPYSILGFSNKHYVRQGATIKHNTGDINTFCLDVEHLEFFNHEMSNNDFKDMCKMLYLNPTANAGISLYLTPLDDSLFLMNTYTEYFKNKYNIDKMNLTVLTDGEADRMGQLDSKFMNDEGDIIKQFKDVTFYIHDKSSKRYYSFRNDQSYESTSILLKSIKEKMDINVTFIYITQESDDYLRTRIDNNIGRYSLIEKTDASIQMKANGYAHLYSNEIDNFYITSSYNIEVGFGKFDYDGNSLKDLGERFKNNSKNIKRNRLMLTHFVKSIA